MRILIVEDDKPTSNLLVAALTAHHYLVDVVADGESALEVANLLDYDVIILDLQLPKLDGLSVCRQLRQQGKQSYILMLTVSNTEQEVIQGLESGADDYVVKPCTPEQIIARVRALLRREKSLTPSGLLTWGELSLDTLSALVTYRQQAIQLRSQEYQLLTLFLRYPQRVFSHSDIIDYLWPMGDYPSKSTVTNLVKDTRRKLKLGGMEEDILETLYGLGYRLKNPPQKSIKLTDIPEISTLSSNFQKSLAQRLAILETAAQSLAANQITPALGQQARQEAHRLAGSLGTYGCIQGSILAQRIEKFWQEADGDKPEQIPELQTLMSALKNAVSCSTFSQE